MRRSQRSACIHVDYRYMLTLSHVNVYKPIVIESTGEIKEI